MIVKLVNYGGNLDVLKNILPVKICKPSGQTDVQEKQQEMSTTDIVMLASTATDIEHIELYGNW